jgi:hypothetical protein
MAAMRQKMVVVVVVVHFCKAGILISGHACHCACCSSCLRFKFMFAIKDCIATATRHQRRFVPGRAMVPNALLPWD